LAQSAANLDLVQILRGHWLAMARTALADALGISLRTLYRDMKKK